jgi:MFS family permease
VRIVALVSGAHLLSHFFQLALAPLFPVLSAEFGVSYVELGALTTVFYATSGVCQAFAGTLVDRFGAGRVLIAGVSLLAGAIAAAAAVTSYWMLIPIAVVAGLGNSVFHPADLAILSTRISKRIMGRAYSAHATCGTLGYALALVVIGNLAALVGWREALLGAAALGLCGAAVLWICRSELDAHRRHKVEEGAASKSYFAVIANPVVLSAFIYFALMAGAGIGVQNFATVAMVNLFGVTLSAATAAVATYIAGTAVGTMIGGVIADRTQRHDMVAISGLCVAALFMMLAATGALGFAGTIATLVLAGLSAGTTAPSRDMLVRAITPPAAAGRIFGFVYSGLDAGSFVAPLIFGWLIDHGMPSAIFTANALLVVLAVGSILSFRRAMPRKAPA